MGCTDKNPSIIWGDFNWFLLFWFWIFLHFKTSSANIIPQPLSFPQMYLLHIRGYIWLHAKFLFVILSSPWIPGAGGGPRTLGISPLTARSEATPSAYTSYKWHTYICIIYFIVHTYLVTLHSTPCHDPCKWYKYMAHQVHTYFVTLHTLFTASETLSACMHTS